MKERVWFSKKPGRQNKIGKFLFLLFSLYLLAAAPQLASADESEAETGTETTSSSDTVNCDEQGEDQECGGPGPGEIPGGDLPSILAGNPINILSGNKRQKEIDFAIPGSKLTFRRTYNSEISDRNINLGQGWSHSYAVSLYSVGAQLQIVQSNGSRLYFSEDGLDQDGRSLWRSAHANEGHLIKTDDNRYDWHLNDGRTLRFQGSFLVQIEWPGYQYLKLFYKNKRLAEVTDETGRVLTLEYHPRGELVQYTKSRFGAAAGHLSSVTLPDGQKIGYDYDQSKNLSRVRFADETSREYHFEDAIYPNNLTGITDRLGARSATWAYDDSGRAISSERANGLQRLTIEYPDAIAVDGGEIVETKITSVLGNQSIYKWIKPGHGQRAQLLSSTGVSCTTCPATGFNYVYDYEGRLLSKTHNEQGIAVGVKNVRIAYDQQGRVIERWISDELGQEQLSERLEYDGKSLRPTKRYTSSINPDALQVTEIARDEQGLPVRITKQGYAPELDANGATSRFTPIEHVIRIGYEAGRMVSVDGPREDVDDTARFGWDEHNRMISMAMPDSPTMRIAEFDSLGRAVKFVRGSDSGGSSSQVIFSYNHASQIQSVTQMGRTLKLRYDAEGRLTGVVNRVGREMELQYDDAGQLLSLEYVGGQRLTQEYDDEGHIVEQRLLDQYGDMIRSVSAYYDARGRVASVTRNATVGGMAAAQSTVMDFEYDQNNRAERAIDRDTGARIDVEYNLLGNLSGMASTTGRAIKLGYDAVGNPVSLTDANDNKTTFVRDDFGRIVAAVSADVGISLYRYDGAGNPIRWTNPDGEATVYSWDAANRPLHISNNEAVKTFKYDAATGLLSESSNDVTTERFSYTQNGQLHRHERTIDQHTFVTEYQYDDQGRMIGRQLPDGQSLRYHYYPDDKLLGRLRAITRSSVFGLRQEVLLAEIDEDPMDGITGFIAHNGKRTTRTHSSDGRIVRIEVSDAMSLDYRYDKHGRITGIEENGIAQSFSYTNGYLSSANTLTGTYVFDYDSSGNRTGKSLTHPDGVISQERYEYSQKGSGNQLLAHGGNADAEVAGIVYNNSGSPLTRGALRYEYNTDQRPVRVYKDSVLLAEYAYNSFGERIKKVSYRNDQKRITYFLYDGHRISAVIPADDTSSMEHTIYLNGHPVFQLLGQSAYAVHTDKLGTTHMLSDENGEIAWQAEYSPFGRATILIDDVAFNHRLPGHFEDLETGTHYNYLRDYDPDSGRYLTSDPLSINGGLNTYLYANADPLNKVDVLGLRPDDSAAFPDLGSDLEGTEITEAQYLELHGYASNGQGLEYFQLLFQMTNHGIYDDFADSYQGGPTTAAMLVLRELFMRNGTNKIEKIFCGVNEGDSIYLIPEVDVLASAIFQAQGIGRATGGFFVDGAKSIWSLGVGLVNFVFDSTIGIHGDVQNMLADYFDAPSFQLPAWYPSYSDAVQTLDDLGTQTLAIAENIRQHPELIWEGLTEPYVTAWAERRYGETATGVVLDIASMFIGAGAAAKVDSLVEVLTVLKRADTATPGELSQELDEIAELMREQGEDLDLLRQAAEELGLDDISQLTPNQIGRVGEDAVNAVHDIGGKQTISINGRDRIPDGINETTLSEVKNVKSLSYTQQLRDFADIAAARGLQYDLYVRPSTELSGPLLAAIEAGTINLKFIPGVN